MGQTKKNLLTMMVITVIAIGITLGIKYCNARFAVSEIPSVILLVVTFIAFTVTMLCLLSKADKLPKNAVIYLIYFGFLLRVIHLIYSPATYFQNDLGALEAGNNGNMGYVYVLFSTGKLPVGNPMEHYQFYHPPLHFAICALFLKIIALVKGGMPGKALDVLRILPLIYSTVTLFFLDKIAKKMDIKPEGRIVAIGILTFMPYQVFLSGALNNDALMIMLSVMAFYFTLVWYEKPSFKAVIAMAACIGLAMMTKVSAGMIAPGIGVLMLKKAWDNRDSWKDYFKQFIVFAAVVFPLGLWHGVLRFIQYRMPFTYAPALPEDSTQKIADYSLWERLFDFKKSFNVLHLQWARTDGFIDHNFFTILVKYSIFGETSFSDADKLINALSIAMVSVTVIVFLLMIAGIIHFAFSKRVSTRDKILSLVTIAVSLVMYIKFSMDMPFLAAMNIRYVLIAFYFGVIALGWSMSAVRNKLLERKTKGAMIAGNALLMLLVLYMAIALILVINLEILF